MKNGILVGGNWIIDQVKVIDIYPAEEKLVNVLAEYSSNGGSAYNVLKALHKLGVAFPLEGVGLVGQDERGERIIEECRTLCIDTRQLRKTARANTSYTDVMSVRSTGKRTFFHQRGANALLDESDFDLGNSNARIFHLGYLLLLDQLDIPDSNGATGAANLFKAAKSNGCITSADLVSENSNRFRQIIPAALPYLDYLYVNEFEAMMLTGIDTTSKDDLPDLEGCYAAAAAILEMGVQRWVVLHFPDGALALNNKGDKIFQSSIAVPPERIAGSVGAGDAFAAGVLIGVHQDWDMRKCLQLGICAAASSLFEATSSDGILSAEECLLLPQLYGFRKEPEGRTYCG